VTLGSRDTATSVVPARAQLGECPLWSSAEACLYWEDIDGRSVHRFDPATGTDEVRDAPGRPGSLALTPTAGRLLVAIEGRLSFLDWSTGAWQDWIDLEPEALGNRMNDGRCDPAGRFWVGSMRDPSLDRRATGSLYLIDGEGRTTVVRTGIGVPNGTAFSPDGRTMYFADTHRDTVWAYDYDIETGEATNERVFLDFADLPGRPDGACVDEDGCYWIACVYGSAVLRVTPAGAVDRQIAVPAPKPTMVAFGGPSLSTLFITSIGGGGSHAVDPAQPEAGHLFAVETGYRGIPEPVFVGGPAVPA
jgi:sugar lactone lactonase YvrE